VIEFRARSHCNGARAETERSSREPPDQPVAKGDAFVLLADVLGAAGRVDEAIAAYSEAQALYEQKENLVGAERVSRSLASLQVKAGA
jgi:hypothetical protein